MKSQNRDSTPIKGTATQRLASHLLNQDIDDFIAQKRNAGVTWRFIARDLCDATDGQIDVTYETLRQWSSEMKAGDAA